MNKAIIAIYLTRLLYPYKPFLDDYIQYRVYNLHPNPLKRIFIEAGTCATRPAANLLDLILFSKFGNILYIPYIFFVMLYLGFILMLKALLDNCGIKVGNIFLITALLCPINIEGTAWISAATRIVPGLFLAVLSLQIITGGYNTKRLVLFAATNLAAYLFYEQTAAFILLLTGLISHIKKTYAPIFISLINASIVGIYYLIFRNYGVFSHRVSFPAISPTEIINGLKSCFSACLYTLRQGGIIAVVIALPIMIISSVTENTCFSYRKLFLGIGIALLSLIPPIITGLYYIPFRCLTIPLIGVALILDNISHTKLSKAVAAVLAITFISSSAVEFKKYDTSTDTDLKIINSIAETVSAGEGKTIAVHYPKKYYAKSPANHAEHIAAITSSDWALTGALRSKLKNPNYPLIGINKEADINIYLNTNR